MRFSNATPFTMPYAFSVLVGGGVARAKIIYRFMALEICVVAGGGGGCCCCCSSSTWKMCNASQPTNHPTRQSANQMTNNRKPSRVSLDNTIKPRQSNCVRTVLAQNDEGKVYNEAGSSSDINTHADMHDAYGKTKIAKVSLRRMCGFSFLFFSFSILWSNKKVYTKQTSNSRECKYRAQEFQQANNSSYCWLVGWLGQFSIHIQIQRHITCDG